MFFRSFLRNFCLYYPASLLTITTENIWVCICGQYCSVAPFWLNTMLDYVRPCNRIKKKTSALKMIKPVISFYIPPLPPLCWLCELLQGLEMKALFQSIGSLSHCVVSLVNSPGVISAKIRLSIMSNYRQACGPHSVFTLSLTPALRHATPVPCVVG